MSQNRPPPWQAHSAPDYDKKMEIRCDALLADITTSQTRRRNILADPRDLHRELFADFAPPGYAEYAGTYRGTAGTSLEMRICKSPSILNPGTNFEFAVPADVPANMVGLLTNIRTGMAIGGSDHDNLFKASMAFGYFGMIHPFIDGNGHVQRAIFAAMITELGYPLNARFALHPRPFDALLAIALELFTKTGQQHVEGSLLAEYLGYYVDGPFLSVRGTLEPGSIY
jgi:fido (protein-threonine AMPylation protein)